MCAAITERRRRGDAWLQQPLYVVVEKILGRGEPLPEDWPVQGTTGYEFLNALNGLFVDGSHVTHFSRLYQRWSGMDPSFRPYVYEKKMLILQVTLSSELQVLAHQLNRTLGDGSLVARFHAQQPAPCPAANHRLLSGVSFLHPRREHLDARPLSRPDGRRDEPAAQPGHERLVVHLHPRHLAAEAARGCQRGVRRGPAALRRQVPAGDVAGDGQGRRGHGLLRLQSSPLAQRGRRRSGAVRHGAGGLSPLPIRTAANAGRAACRPPPRTTPSAARTCVRA